MSDLISREYMKSLGATCIAQRLKDGTLFPIVAIDELPPADLTHPTPSNTLGALDCVERQKAIDAIVNTVSEIWNHDSSEVARYGATFRQHEILDIIESLPSVQPRRGKWAGKGDSEGFGIFICDNCGKFSMMEYDFCPNCGADMRGGQDESIITM